LSTEDASWVGSSEGHFMELEMVNFVNFKGYFDKIMIRRRRRR